jgi:hypothetical protein
MPDIASNHDNLLSHIEQEATGPATDVTQGSRTTRKPDKLTFIRPDDRGRNSNKLRRYAAHDPALRLRKCTNSSLRL